MSAIDFANYTPVPNSAQLEALRERGVARAIVGASYDAFARAQAAAFHDAGFEVEGYAWLTPGPAPYLPVHAAIEALSDVGVGRWWLDCEEEMGVLTPAAVRERIRKSLVLLLMEQPAARRGVYTTRAWWQRWTGDWDLSSEFPDCDLWEAHWVHGEHDECRGYENERDAIPPFVPFGGWTSRAMVQWHPSTLICADVDGGLNVDLDEIEEDPMAAPTIGEFQAAVGLLVRVNQTLDAVTGAFFDLAKHVYGESDPAIADLRYQLAKIEASTPVTSLLG